MTSTNHFWQTHLTLPSKPRGFHLITTNIHNALMAMPNIEIGLIHIFLQHTSASLTISENTCSEVAQDLEAHFNKAVLEDPELYQHTLEGADDMPAHIKNAILGGNLSIPLSNNQLQLGRWQGIFLCEHRNHAPSRQLILTVMGSSPD